MTAERRDIDPVCGMTLDSDWGKTPRPGFLPPE